MPLSEKHAHEPSASAFASEVFHSSISNINRMCVCEPCISCEEFEKKRSPFAACRSVLHTETQRCRSTLRAVRRSDGKRICQQRRLPINPGSSAGSSPPTENRVRAPRFTCFNSVSVHLEQDDRSSDVPCHVQHCLELAKTKHPRRSQEGLTHISQAHSAKHLENHFLLTITLSSGAPVLLRARPSIGLRCQCLFDRLVWSDMKLLAGPPPSSAIPAHAAPMRMVAMAAHTSE